MMNTNELLKISEDAHWHCFSVPTKYFHSSLKFFLFSHDLLRSLYVSCSLFIVEIKFLYFSCFLIFLFPMYCFANHDTEFASATVWNLIHSKEDVYVTSRSAIKKIPEVDHSLKKMRHHLTFKFKKSKIVKYLGSSTELYSIVTTGRVKFKIDNFKLRYSFKKNLFKISYTYRL